MLRDACTYQAVFILVHCKAHSTIAALATHLSTWFLGSLPPKAQPGNDRPRVFRLPMQNALINRMGFNSKGIDDAEPRLHQYHQRRLDGTSDGSKVLLCACTLYLSFVVTV